ncbi:hypothetical protein GWO43_17375 [candidate division KSB1 bacterium]|nr:hypothetical protein [candidate division KSB1 bacterium]NIR69632.1 hypothetical protein [candidate division KSB1 bacterium]NIS25739.1 hypothetical protein [candidate division KSB1 bacterium]NIT72608.1 hypothetical protein [candidate division KSB1 bacterium]NIU26420.1 hypothetical protein [candidate division KSB1 bacterium]
MKAKENITERKLVVSVVLRAVKDYIDGHNPNKIGQLKAKGLDHELTQLEKNCKSARFWLYEERNSDYIFSFEKCCEIISISPERIRRGLRQLIEARYATPKREIRRAVH